ncbi:MAG TPA: helix-turn-helix domain-containing protein [Candidatus Scatovicinus merdipullorum]|nr:helix-turn-helix domain-containing protein [Candidatus Scatovicinus merdipullorum]
MSQQEQQPVSNKLILSASDVMKILNVSRSTAYRIIRSLNHELDNAGKITVAGKISAKYFFEKMYL